MSRSLSSRKPSRAARAVPQKSPPVSHFAPTGSPRQASILEALLVVNKTWRLDLKKLSSGWQSLPPMPATARQGSAATVIDHSLYVMGGINYTERCHDDTYRLTKHHNEWSWKRLPDLPWKSCFAGAATAASQVLVFGGCDFGDAAGGIYCTAADRNGGTPRLGARLIALDARNLQATWQELPECPGTPRFMTATAIAGRHLYVLGGITGMDNPQKQIQIVVDNWRYDLEAKSGSGWPTCRLQLVLRQFLILG